MRPYLDLIDTTTQARYDVTPLFADAQGFAHLVADLLAPFASAFELVAGIDALGFILGAAMASSSGRGFLPIRKGGRLPGHASSIAIRDYSGTDKTLEIRPCSLAGARILLVDDWIETGAQVGAAIRLIESCAGTVAGVVAICIDENEATANLRQAYRCHSVWPHPES
jgi:adenine phosphoribosyltransferase